MYSGGVASPESAAEREFFTEEEAARFAALVLEGRERFGYVARSLDAGTGLLSTRQTALVVDPPDGTGADQGLGRIGPRPQQTA